MIAATNSTRQYPRRRKAPRRADVQVSARREANETEAPRKSPVASPDAVGDGVRLLAGSLWHHAEVIQESLAGLYQDLLSQQASSSSVREHLILIGLRAEQMRAICRAAESELARRASREPERSIR